MKNTMKAAVYKGNGIVEVKDIDIPKIRHSKDVLIKVEAASICGSDLHVTSVPPTQHAKEGIALGHEFVGYVEQIGNEVTEFSIGDRVVPDPILKCGTCEVCRMGHENLCNNEDIVGQLRDGGFAEYCVVPENNLYLISKDIPPSIAAQTEPLACVMNAILKLKPSPLDRVVIFGAGAIGLTFIRTLKTYGVIDIVVCETMEERKKDALRCGASLVLNPMVDDLKTILIKEWGTLATVVIDAVGVGVVMEQGIPLLKEAGTFLNFGQNSTAKATISPAEIVRKELKILGSYSTHNSFPAAIQLEKNTNLNLDLLISHELPLADINKAFLLLKNKEASRIIIYPNND